MKPVGCSRIAASLSSIGANVPIEVGTFEIDLSKVQVLYHECTVLSYCKKYFSNLLNENTVKGSVPTCLSSLWDWMQHKGAKLNSLYQ